MVATDTVKSGRPLFCLPSLILSLYLPRYQEVSGHSGGSAVGGGAGATGGGNDEVFFESDTNVTTDYTITSGKNAHTVSPVINSGVTVTVPSGSLLVII